MAKNQKSIEVPVRCKYSSMEDPTQLIPHPKNPQKHPANQIRLFQKILKHQGWRRPIVVSNRSGFIVTGHGAWEAAKLMKLAQVPVDRQDFQNAEDELAHLLADNELPKMAEREDGVFADLLRELEIKSVDLDLTAISYTPGDKKSSYVEKVDFRQKPPVMTYVLIAIPTVRFSEISSTIETISRMDDVEVETSISTK